MAKKKPKPASASDNGRKERPYLADEPKYFLSLSLRNVRCFGEETQTLDLSGGQGRPAQWTILLGDNGTGKSTILQALALFPVAYDGGRLISHQGKLRWPAFLWIHPQSYPLYRELSEPAELVIKVAFGTRLGAPRGAIETYKYYLTQKPSVITTSVGEPHVPLCFGYGAGRRLGTGALANDWREDLIANLFSDDVPLRNAEEWLSRLHWAASQPSDVQAAQEARLKQVKEVLVQILPDVSATRIIAPQKESDIPRFEFETPYGWVSLRQLGYGYQTMIAWMVDFASRMVERYPDSADPLAEPAVVLVDEIDLHLHPRWQRELMGYLTERFPNTQFIATAHSPLIVQAAPSVNANIAVLRRDGDHVGIYNNR